MTGSERGRGGERTCPVCGERFTAHAPTARYCSRRCRDKESRQRVRERCLAGEVPAKKVERYTPSRERWELRAEVLREVRMRSRGGI